VPPGASMCPQCGWQEGAPGAWPPVVPSRLPPLPPPPRALSWSAQAGLLIGGIVAGIIALWGGSALGSYLSVPWLGVLLMIVLFFATLGRRGSFFSTGVLLSVPLLVLGAIAACFYSVGHYGR